MAIENLFKQTGSESHQLLVSEHKAAASNAPPPSSKPETKQHLDGTDSSVSAVPLPLYLLSVSPGRNSLEGSASIGTSIDNPQVYAAGAILANGSRLTEIHDNYVVLTRDKRTARLYLYDRRNASPALVSDDLLTVGGTTTQVARSKSASREVLTDYLRPSPIYDGETLLGYQVYPGAKSGVFGQLGLQPGDLIVAVDDVPLNEPAQALDTLRQLTDGALLKLSVVRKQNLLQITAAGALVAADKEKAAILQQSFASERSPL